MSRLCDVRNRACSENNLATFADRVPNARITADGHVANRVDPIDDIEVVHTELALADLDTLDKRVEKPVFLRISSATAR